MKRYEIASPYGKGRIRQLLAQGSVCVGGENNHPTFPKDGYEDCILVFRYGRGGKKTVERKARLRWAENRYPAAWQDIPNLLHDEEGARSEIATRELLVPCQCVGRFTPYYLK